MSEVVTYRNTDRQCFCQIRLDSGERILISFAGLPRPSLKVFKLALGGLFPFGTVWGITPEETGGLEGYVKKIARMFPPKGVVHPLDVIRDLLLQCSSIADAQSALRAAEERAIG